MGPESKREFFVCYCIGKTKQIDYSKTRSNFDYENDLK